MEFQTARQIQPGSLQNVDYDIFILSLGFEKRCIYLAEKFNINAKLRIALAFEEKSKDLNRRKNERFIQTKGFKIIKASGEKPIDLKPYLTELINISGKKHFHILVDYSSMTKVWYSGIINDILKDSLPCEQLTVDFSYTPAYYSKPKKTGSSKVSEMISFPDKKITEKDKPVALLVGLGLDKASAEFIIKNVNPDLTILMYADPALEIKYVESVFRYNQDIINEAEVRNLISFPLHDLEKTDEILTDLCLRLRIKYKLVIAPVGPKVFSLISILLASRYPDINVIRVAGGSANPASERLPLGDPYIYSVDFVSDSVEF